MAPDLAPESSMLGISLIILTFAAHAEEGFQTAAPPAALTRAWNATVLLFSGTTGDIGVTSAVAVRRDGDVVNFLTVNHLLEAGCGSTKCTNLKILRDLNLPWSKRRRLRDASIARSVEIVARDVDRDLAILRVRTALAIEPIALVARCDASYQTSFALGFPVTADRPAPLGILEPEILRKRWSTGHVIGPAALDADGGIFFGVRPNTRAVIVTSTDALPGSSGGPLVDDAGLLIGLVDRTGSKDGVYKGRGKAESSQINAIATPCEVVRSFLSTSLGI